MDLAQLSATETTGLVKTGQLSIVESITASLDRVAMGNPLINAVCTVNHRALEQAAQAEARLRSGQAARPLEGVPFVAKDNLLTSGLLTTFGSLLYRDSVPAETSLSVQRMLDAGAILIGKSNLPEFAHDINSVNALFGLTRNPVDLNVTAGGSSGGTAAAVAGGLTPVGLGTDLGGSIRIPSSFCGICGLRPSAGRIPVHPSEFAWDTLVAHVHGPMTRTVPDLGLLLSVLAGPDDRDPMSLPASPADYVAAASGNHDLLGRRGGLLMNLMDLVAIDAEVERLVSQAASDLSDLGCVLDNARLDASHVKPAVNGTRAFGMVARYAEIYRNSGEVLSAALKSQVGGAMGVDLLALADSERHRSMFYHAVARLLEHFDFLVCPTVAVPAMRLDEPLPRSVGGHPISSFYDVFYACYAFSLTGLPSVSVPCGFTSAGLPVGLQIIGRRHRDDSLLEVASCYARHHPEHFRSPGISTSIANDASLATRGVTIG